jgi:hypothetical protein
MAGWLLDDDDDDVATGDGRVPFDGAGARDLAGQLDQLAAAWEEGFQRRLVAAEAAARRWTGPLGHELGSRLALEAGRSQTLVAELRSEALAWWAAADEAEGRP